MLFVYSTCTYWTSDMCQTLRQGPELFFKAMYFFDSTEHRTYSHLRIYGAVYFNFACLAHLYAGSYLKVKTYLFYLPTRNLESIFSTCPQETWSLEVKGLIGEQLNKLPKPTFNTYGLVTEGDCDEILKVQLLQRGVRVQSDEPRKEGCAPPFRRFGGPWQCRQKKSAEHKNKRTLGKPQIISLGDVFRNRRT